MNKTMLVIMVLLISTIFSQNLNITFTDDDILLVTTTKDIYISFVLDETGSMKERKSETISSFNEYLDMLQGKDENVFMTLTKFNSGNISVIYNDVNVNYLCGLSNKTYYPNSMTPLYDAIGKTINDIGEVDNMLFVILTDGLENASREYSQIDIFKLIENKKEMGWTFVFMGADQDSYVAESIGIDIGNIITFDADSISVTMGLLINCSNTYIANDAIQTTRFFNEADEEENE